MGEALAPGLGDRAGSAQQVEGAKLEVGEVRASALRLQPPVLAVVCRQERLDALQALARALSLARGEFGVIVLLLDGAHRRARIRESRRINALASEPLVRSHDHVPKARPVERGRIPRRLAAAVGDHLLKRDVERLRPQASGLGLVENAEARIEIQAMHPVGRIRRGRSVAFEQKPLGKRVPAPV